MKTHLNFITTLLLIAAFAFSGSSQNYKRLSDFPEQIRNSKPFKRLEWDYVQRAFPYDTIPNIYASHVTAMEVQKIKQQSNKGRNNINWFPKGPSFADATNIWPDWDTVSGRVRAMAIHPTDHLTVYIGAASGGLWKTTDGGESWLDIGHDLESITFGAIAIDPNNPETIYAGSGEAASKIANILFGGTSMYKTTDGGSTWDTINAFGDYTAFTDIVVSPFNSDVVFASLANGPFSLFGPYPNEGIWKSTDAGNSWEKTLDLPWAFDIALHPTDPDKVYACIGGRWTYTSGGIYVSTDQGNTWNVSNTGLPDPEIINRLQMDISQTHPDTMYTVIYLLADTLTYGEYTRVYKSINGGSSWFQISADVPLGGYTGSYWHDQGWYTLCIAVDPTNSEHVFIGNIELHETTDGQNFSPVRYPGGTDYFKSIAHVDYHQLKFAPSNPDYFYIGCDGGVYRSTDGCNSAVSRNVGLETIQFYRMGSHPNNTDIMIAGTQDNGTMRTIDGGNSWTLVSGGDGMECFFDYEYPDSLVYSSQEYGRLMRSRNGGESFSHFGNMYGAWVAPFFIHPFGHDTLYSANDDIYKYNGSSFQTITTGLSPYLINTMAQSRINPRNMILASSSHENGILTPDFPLMVSADGGSTWTEITTNIPGEIRWISRVATHPYDENTMFVVRCGFSEGNKIYRTTDLGQNWENISGNLPDIPCNDMFIDPDNIQDIYVGTDLGVYLSEDGGASYEYAGGDMPFVPILDFDYVKVENTSYLRVATFGRGIYETDLAIDIREKEILSQGAIMAKPNPFTSEVTLEYELQRSSNAQMNLYNQLGKKVMELLNKHQAKGKYELKINGNNLPAGIYFCTLKTNEGVFTRKLLKME